MARCASLTVDAVRALRGVLAMDGPGVRAARRATFSPARGRPFADVAALADYHDLLLFVLAHPASREEVVRARSELVRVARAARAIRRKPR